MTPRRAWWWRLSRTAHGRCAGGLLRTEPLHRDPPSARGKRLSRILQVGLASFDAESCSNLQLTQFIDYSPSYSILLCILESAAPGESRNAAVPARRHTENMMRYVYIRASEFHNLEGQGDDTQPHLIRAAFILNAGSDHRRVLLLNEGLDAADRHA